MKSENRLIIVSNRLPFRYTEREGRIIVTPSAGGLVSSIGSYLDKAMGPAPMDHARPVWVGATELRTRRLAKLLASGAQLDGGRYEVRPVALPDVTRDRHYNGFSNSTLWPLFHYFPSVARYEQDWFDHYRVANQLFLGTLEQTVRPGDRVWIHDYHLMLLPAMLRARFPDLPISFFLHIPFPSYEMFRLLPAAWRTELLEGVLGADLVGLQTHDHAQYLLKSVQQLLGYELDLRTVRGRAHSTVVDAFPVSIDPARFREAFDDHAVVAEKNLLRRSTMGQRVILSIDRLDYIKGVLQRLEGYEHFLDTHPEMVGKVTFILLIVPSRDAITKYRELKEGIEAAAGRINGRFGGVDWQPVVYQYRSVNHKKLCALYQSADVALITPLRDGMNLVAKEFVAARKDRRGVLILSETAGAANELGGAILINPTDRDAIAGALHAALEMPAEEQSLRMAEMQQRLTRYDVVRWAEDLLDQLDGAVAIRRQLQVKEATPEVRQTFLSAYAKARSRWIFLDHDGTLVPFSKRPADAAPGKPLLALLGQLAVDPRNAVAIVSGRDRDTLGAWYGSLPVHLIAEHGAYARPPNGSWSVPDWRTEWKETVIALFQQFHDRCPGSLVEEKTTAVAWHYRGAAQDLGFLRSRELVNVLNDMARSFDFQVIEGNMVIEVRPRGIDKGTAVRRALEERPGELVMAIGDDRTDEDIFKVLPIDAMSIKVGMVPSFARYNVRSHEDVLALLGSLAATPDPAVVMAV
ncbi:MAG: bifunctional alpha,alpha-trehalose-phosphate synthase (UDP-forming)/trehalose-phosphatase [Flavobacteriales bacterium]|nr:bifunctional alpha,alpha-trehalose-phosphate synthase (UDP-forming)/trehalose-phosphatase [Flavobacteriales bacterium]